jgi:phosphatidylserine/phosphatidylglycerophosphate/cardiolipin synthase-like enzyme
LTKAEIVGTGPDFVTKGIRGIEPLTEETIRSAASEIQIMAYVFTRRALHLLALLEKAAEQGIQITIIVNHLNSQEPIIVSKLRELADHFPYVKVLDFNVRRQQLHAKVIIADRARAILGSANFSWGGLYANYEVGVRVEGELAWKLSGLVDSLGAGLKKIYPFRISA